MDREPTNVDPRRKPDPAQQQLDDVVERLEENAEEVDKAANLPNTFPKPGDQGNKGPHFPGLG